VLFDNLRYLRYTLLILYIKFMELTNKQKEVLSAINKLISKSGSSPTLKEIQELLGYKEISSVQRHTEALKKKGFLSSNKHQSRGLRIVKKMSKKANIPLLGCVACGNPILAIENIEAYIPYEVKGDPKEYFFLRAEGDSMDKAGINDGDLVLIKNQQSPQEGEQVLALVGDDATIKIFKRGADCVILEPKSSNPEHKPIYVFDDLQIQGKVVGKIAGNKK
jgi:repressor LexA